ncbi:MAG TPA: hypothetical protein VGO67_16430 [Verrucomicrobiae bacterium]|jgi:hypothetical protein
MKSKPTIDQIAHLCAVLVTKSKDPLDAIAAKAVDIWLAAESEIERRFSGKNYTSMVHAEIAKMKAQFPQPKGYPVDHDSFAKLMLPKSDTGERASVFRRVENGDQGAYSRLRATSYPDEVSYLNAAKKFTEQYEFIKKQSISNVRRGASHHSS